MHLHVTAISAHPAASSLHAGAHDGAEPLALLAGFHAGAVPLALLAGCDAAPDADLLHPVVLCGVPARARVHAAELAEGAGLPVMVLSKNRNDICC